VPSVLVPRDDAAIAAFRELTARALAACVEPGAAACLQLQIYHDLTGNVGSPQDARVAISPSMRSAPYHVVLAGADTVRLAPWYKAFSHAYFSESDLTLDAAAYPARLWGDANYRRLGAIKASVDPQRVFGCRHCIGDL
jgi:hypothetical protein